MGECVIRVASPEDAPRLLEIYSYYVENTAVTFEYDVPSLEEFRGRIEKTLKRYPYLVLEEEGRILGYIYAGPFQTRRAYSWSCELSIYFDKDVRRRGYGRKLHEAIEPILKAMGVCNIYGEVAFPDDEDEYLTRNSIDAHQHMGFRVVGEMHKCGYKFGRWYNMSWMEKYIGNHNDNQPEVIPFPDVSRETVSAILKNAVSGQASG